MKKAKCPKFRNKFFLESILYRDDKERGDFRYFKVLVFFLVQLLH